MLPYIYQSSEIRADKTGTQVNVVVNMSCLTTSKLLEIIDFH